MFWLLVEGFLGKHDAVKIEKESKRLAKAGYNSKWFHNQWKDSKNHLQNTLRKAPDVNNKSSPTFSVCFFKT